MKYYIRNKKSRIFYKGIKGTLVWFRTFDYANLFRMGLANSEDFEIVTFNG